MPGTATVVPRYRSLIPPRGFALFDKGGHALRRVAGLEGEGVEVGFALEAVVESCVERAGDGVAGEGEGGQGVAGHLAGIGLASLDEVALGEAVDDSDAQCLLAT